MTKKEKNKKNSKWICGRAREGEQCHRGPDDKGNCRADTACHPNQKNGSWHCTRPVEMGGTCNSSPSTKGECPHQIVPCQPQLSAQAKRRYLLTTVILLCVSFLLLTLSSPIFSDKLEPGQLSSAHRSIEKCDACHNAFEHSPIKAASALITGHFAGKDSQRCLTCHQFGKHPLLPHTAAKNLLDPLTRQSKNSLATALKMTFSDKLTQQLPYIKTTKSKIECRQCHREHKGVHANIKTMSNAMCQTCHQNRFHNFSNDHPDFKKYPHVRRTHLIFDHNSHFNKHFKDEKVKKQSPQECVACHQLDKRGAHMVLKPYEKICAACHHDDIMGDGRVASKGIQFLTVPGLDIETLQKKGISIGQWPSDADGEMTPFMPLLLRGAMLHQKAAQHIREIDLLNLEEASPAQLQAVAQLAWAIKRYLLKVSKHGSEKAYPNHPFSKAAIDARPESMPEDTVDTFIASLFPNIALEIKAHDEQHKKVLTQASTQQSKKISGLKKQKNHEDWMKHGGWYSDEFSLYYRPRQHEDQFMYRWITVASQLKDNALFNVLTEPKAPGACGKCHSVEKGKADALTMNWTMHDPSDAPLRLTHFSHKAHLPLMKKDDCKMCHQINKKADYLASFEKNNSDRFVSNFKSIEKSRCASCHSPEKAKADCLVCHRYHIANKKGG